MSRLGVQNGQTQFQKQLEELREAQKFSGVLNNKLLCLYSTYTTLILDVTLSVSYLESWIH